MPEILEGRQFWKDDHRHVWVVAQRVVEEE